ncbi:MAG: hypothetical protein IPP66_16810 [Anaerolineales bacterium]|nr:hypothetical protein [Anaerolineales bacterium]
MKKLFLYVLTLLSVMSLACSAWTRLLPTTSTPEPEPNFEPVTTRLLITPESLPEAQVGVAYEVEMKITQNVTPVGDMTIQEGTLPAGLEFIFLNGEDAAQIKGTPEEAGVFEITVFAWCYGTQVSGQTLMKKYEIVVKE